MNPHPAGGLLLDSTREPGFALVSGVLEVFKEVCWAYFAEAVAVHLHCHAAYAGHDEAVIEVSLVANPRSQGKLFRFPRAEMFGGGDAESCWVFGLVWRVDGFRPLIGKLVKPFQLPLPEGFYMLQVEVFGVGGGEV